MKSDSQLQQDVSAELQWEPSINGARIGVEVSQGVVTLAGQVDTYSEKWSAERAAQRVSGVEALATELKVQLSGPHQRTDGEIAQSVKTALEWSTSVPAKAVKVMVEKGWVTLAGDVSWQFQRQAAIDSVRYLFGVTGVTDNIALKPPLSVSAVKSDIEAALKRSAATEAHKIEVEIKGADVTLTGKVHSWSERETAKNSAWGTPGVRNVVDRLTIAY
jgi:osmotically-inducible protein OsmY